MLLWCCLPWPAQLAGQLTQRRPPNLVCQPGAGQAWRQLWAEPWAERPLPAPPTPPARPMPQALNVYVDQLAKGGHPRSCTVEFWVKDGDQLNRIQALLPASGTLGPLFLAFGLITEEELRAGAGREEITDVNFLQWLRQTVSEAISMQVGASNWGAAAGGTARLLSTGRCARALSQGGPCV